MEPAAKRKRLQTREVSLAVGSGNSEEEIPRNQLEFNTDRSNTENNKKVTISQLPPDKDAKKPSTRELIDSFNQKHAYLMEKLRWKAANKPASGKIVTLRDELTMLLVEMVMTRRVMIAVMNSRPKARIVQCPGCHHVFQVQQMVPKTRTVATQTDAEGTTDSGTQTEWELMEVDLD